jgi:hypothetical protein
MKIQHVLGLSFIEPNKPHPTLSHDKFDVLDRALLNRNVT